MHYRVVAVGRVRDAALRAACDEYVERLRHYTHVEEREVKDEARVLGAVPEGSRLVALSRTGEQWTSSQVAEWTGKWERDGVYQQVLERQARRLGIADRVRFTGFRLDVPALLAASTVSVLPSLSEGLSNTVLESMAAGIPVVTTSVGGTPEAVTDGETGLLVVPRDPPALARAIGRVLDDPDLARRLGENARDRIERQFSLERMARTTEDLYRALVTRGPRAGKEVARHV